ncbi:MAG TPA: hypothetical protein DCY13_19300 [Verrucomicrobiales bacterium]|nr:hypothetical protein [Verrucomicrobiales bacterium]
MATVYRLICENCLRWPKAPLSDILPATHDGEEYGAVMPAGFLALRLGDGRLQPLVPPFVAAWLKEHGCTLKQARREERLARVDFLLCRICGTMSRTVTRERPMRPVAAFVLGVGSTMALASWWSNLRLPMMLLVGLVVGLGASAVAWIAADWWRQRNLVKGRLEPCRKCQRIEFRTLPQAAGRSWMCPHCRSKELWCRVAGVT